VLIFSLPVGWLKSSFHRYSLLFKLLFADYQIFQNRLAYSHSGLQK